MKTYRLLLEADGSGDERSIEFHGHDPHAALIILESEPANRSAQLWDGDKHLGTLLRSDDGIWILS